MPIKTFKNIIADGGQDTIRLSTNQGLIGYRIKKFQLISQNPGDANAEHCVKIWTVKQDTVNNVVDFSNQQLLAVGLATNASGAYVVFYNERIVFDHVVINQDIYVTHHEQNGSESVNYYIELEQVKLSKDEAAVATLKDMRGTN